MTESSPGVVGIELVSCSVTHDLPHVQLRRVDAARRRTKHVPEGALLRVQYLALWLVSLLVHPVISWTSEMETSANSGQNYQIRNQKSVLNLTLLK